MPDGVVYPSRLCVANAASILGGKLTTYRKMAEVVSDHVCGALGIDMASETATRPLPAADDPGRHDERAAADNGQGPTDADISGHS